MRPAEGPFLRKAIRLARAVRRLGGQSAPWTVRLEKGRSLSRAQVMELTLMTFWTDTANRELFSTGLFQTVVSPNWNLILWAWFAFESVVLFLARRPGAVVHMSVVPGHNTSRVRYWRGSSNSANPYHGIHDAQVRCAGNKVKRRKNPLAWDVATLPSLVA